MINGLLLVGILLYCCYFLYLEYVYEKCIEYEEESLWFLNFFLILKLIDDEVVIVRENYYLYVVCNWMEFIIFNFGFMFYYEILLIIFMLIE